jgi:hypothetical protein
VGDGALGVSELALVQTPEKSLGGESDLAFRVIVQDLRERDLSAITISPSFSTASA